MLIGNRLSAADKRRLAMLYANNQGGNLRQQLLDGAPFLAELTHTAVPQRAATGTTATFTRATTATVRDNEGVLRTAIAGEARFEGARRVRNLVEGGSEYLTASGWTQYGGCSLTGTDTITFAADAASVYYNTPTIPGGTAGKTFLLSAQVRSVSGTQLFRLQNSHGGVLDNYSSDFTATTAAQTFSLVVTNSSSAGTGDQNVGIANKSAGGAGGQVILDWIQLEDITGRADQTTPSEYVSVGVPSDWVGTDLVTNGTFTTDLSGWTLSALEPPTWNAVGAMQMNSTGAQFSIADQQLTTVAGTKYAIAFDMAQGSLLNVYAGTSQGDSSLLSAAPNVDGFFTYTFTATSATTWIRFIDGAGITNQLISNVVVKPAIYHGAGADGVKYFDTDLSGNPIAASINTGYVAEGARTNLCLQSQDFATTWVLGRVTCATNNTVAPDGTTTADTLTAASGTTISHFAFQSGIVPSATTQSYSIYAKAGTSNFICLNLQTAANNYVSKVFDLGNGVLGETSLGSSSGTLVSSRITSVGNGWYRLNIVAQVTGASGLFSIFFANAATGNSFTTTGDITITTAGTETLMVWGAQVELGSFASSHIATTAAAVTRNAEIDAYSTANNITAAAGYISLQFTPTHTPSGTIALWGTYVDASNYTAILHDATNLIFRKRIAGSNYDATIANAFVSGTTYKVAATWGAAGTSISLDGTLGTGHANTTAAQIAATMQFGADGNSLQQPFASVGVGYIGQRQLSASEMQAITS